MNFPRSKLRGITLDLQSRSNKKDFSYPLRPSLLQAAGNPKFNRVLFNNKNNKILFISTSNKAHDMVAAHF